MLVTTTTHSIEAFGYFISNLSGIQYFTSLTWLDCSSNALTSLPTLPNSLDTLLCYGNALSNLPTLPSSLTFLFCSDNSLINLPTLPHSLAFLYCSKNSLTSLPALPNSLTYIECENNFLTSLPTLPHSLQILDCSDNSLTSLPSLPNSLLELGCTHNSLTSLPVLPDTLGFLGCDSNNIVCFPTFPNSITTLYIDPNPYNCLPNHTPAMSSTDLVVPLCTAGNTNGCPVAVAGIEQYNINNEVQVYPNPAKDIINVNGLLINEETHIQLIDMFGNFVGEYITSDKATDIDVSGLSEGVYDILIQNSEVKINKKVVIVK